MDKGMSTWIFSKMVMLIFLTLTFGIIMSFTGLVRQRAKIDSARATTEELKSVAQEIVTTSAESAERLVPIPENIPETDKGNHYTIHVYKTDSGAQNSLVIAIANGLHSNEDEIDSYLTASSMKTAKTINIGGDNDEERGVYRSNETYYILFSMDSGNLNVTGCLIGGEEDCKPW